MNPRYPRPRGAAQRGLSLVELMVAMAIGLVLLAALVGLFVSTSSSRREMDRATELHEAGRYALESLRTEMSQAGFYGGMVIDPAASPAADDLPCSTDADVWRRSLSFHVRGSNRSDTSAQNDTSNLFDCIAAQRKAGTDAVFIQRASTCLTGAAGCAAVQSGRTYLQVSLCGTQFSTSPFLIQQQPAAGVASPFTLMGRACNAAVTAPLRSYIRRIYYVSTNNELSYVDLLPGSVSDPVIVSGGVDNLQIQYAIDDRVGADTTLRDGVPDVFTHVPTAAQWRDVVGARLWLLARSDSAGTQAQGSAFPIGDVTVTPGSSDRFKRHVFSTSVVFTSPQGNRQQ